MRPDSDLPEVLRTRVRGEVRFDAGSRALYATDASNYRQVPIGVVVPVDLDDVVATVATCREFDVPVLGRGGGTSLAGEGCNEAVVIDFSKHVNRIESIDAAAATAIVQPGIVLDELNRATAGHGGLVFGPKPATHGRCTIGGMIGNNSCGATAQWSGTTDANVRRLEILTYDGVRMWVGPTTDAEYERIVAAGGRPAEIYRSLRELRARHAELIRGFPELPRRISGYNLPALLPEQGFDLARALTGTESTCVTVLRAELALLREPPCKAMVLLGYPDVVAAAAAAPAINPFRPYLLEGFDDKLFGYQRGRPTHQRALGALPAGHAWLMVQFGADTPDAALAAALDLVAAVRRGEDPAELAVVADPADQAALMHLREAGLGAASRVPGAPATWPGWEDSAVPPEHLAGYLRDLIDLLDRYGYGSASLYGHFGHGCVHTRVPFDLATPAGVAAFRRFMQEAADLCTAHGGSLSGEHGDGQARGELLSRMYGTEVVGVFEEFKRIFDPDNRMNPGKVVHANPLDGQLRIAGYPSFEPATHFGYPLDGGLFSKAADRCIGVGRCRDPRGAAMCPRYRATGDEQHSTRGRAHLLFEMLRGETITDGWDSQAVADALDACLSCKACKSDCPVGVDMATYKAEFLAHHHAGRVRPREHYSLGWLPALVPLAGLAPGLVNALADAPVLGRLGRRLGGIDPQRGMPRLARASFRRWFAGRTPRGTGERGRVLLWPDTFCTAFAPEITAAAVGVLEAAGFRVVMPRQRVCCGLTWISTGQLGTARRVLRRTLGVLEPYLRDDVPVVGLEPSCTTVLRSDAVDLLGDEPVARRLSGATRTLAELLAERAPEFRPRLAAPDGGRPKAITQTHCHQHAVLGFDADVALMRRIGLDVEVIDDGCCGMAGNFGMTPDHREISQACAERRLLPAIRAADPATLVIADGFSCRTQIIDAGTGCAPVHLAEVVNAAVRGAPVPGPQAVRRSAAPAGGAAARRPALRSWS